MQPGLDRYATCDTDAQVEACSDARLVSRCLLQDSKVVISPATDATKVEELKEGGKTVRDTGCCVAGSLQANHRIASMLWLGPLVVHPIFSAFPPWRLLCD